MPVDVPPSPSAPELEDRLSRVGSRLSGSLGRVLDALPGRPHRPQQLARLLSLNRDISGRVLTAARAENPLAVAHVIPGPEPLRKFLRAARAKDVGPGLLDDAEAAIAEFEALIREQAGDRPALNAIISSLLPESRERFELAAKQMSFKGTSLLKGVMADVWLHAALVHPSRDDPACHDVAHLYGTLGLRRLRPRAAVKFVYRQFGTPTRPWRTLDGCPASEADGRELDRFCTLPPAPLDARPAGDGTIYVLGGDAVGPASAVDKLLAEVQPAAMRRDPGAGERALKSLFVAPGMPVKLLVFDVLLHEDAYPGAVPALVQYDTAVEGMASVNDPARDADRLGVSEHVEPLGRAPRGLAHPDVPRYVEMLEHAAGRLGWHLDAFRAYRCCIQYPLHSAQVCLAFGASF